MRHRSGTLSPGRLLVSSPESPSFACVDLTYSKHVLPCAKWPATLRHHVLGYHALISGGLEEDGWQIENIDDQEIRRACNDTYPGAS